MEHVTTGDSSEKGVVGMAKRWWWVAGVAVLVLVLGAAAFALLGTGGRAPLRTADIPQADSPASTSATPVAEVAAPTNPSAPKSKGDAATAPVKVAAATVAKAGAKLSPIKVPPRETLAQIRYTDARKGQSYDTVFGIYGTGPARAGHGTIVVAFTSFTPQKKYVEPLALKGKNALLEPGPGVSLPKGGTYKGVVKLEKRGEVFVLVLASAKPK